jgi:hypothetical protein
MRQGQIMIWNSVPLMTAIDLFIIAVTVYAIWRCRLIGPSKRPSAPKIGLRWIAIGLLVVCLFYFADLVSMYVLPVVTSMQEATTLMGTLHRNLQLASRSLRDDRDLKWIYRAQARANRVG